MASNIALRVAVLGTAFAAVPALAQQQPLSPPSPNHGEKYLRSDSGRTNASRSIRQRPGFANAWYQRRRIHNHAPSPYYDYYAGTVAPRPTAETITWCERHYRTFNPATGLYRGYDGIVLRCSSPE